MSWEGVSPELVALIEERCTPRQVEALQLLARGYPLAKIARAMDIDRATCRELLTRSRRRLKGAIDIDQL